MTMQNALILSTFLASLSGFVVLMLGEWRHFMLKHSAVFLSTVVSAAVTLMLMSHRILLSNVEGDLFYANWMLYAIASNVRIILFHLAVGRDAIGYKKYGERRGSKRHHVRLKGLY